MKTLLTDLHDSAKCMWCEKTAEAVTVQFESGFLKKGELCWKCLQQAVRVHHRQEPDKKTPERKPAE